MFCPSVGGASSGVASGLRGTGASGSSAFAAGHLPERQMPVAGKLAQRAGIRQRFELATFERRARAQVLHAGERLRGARR